MTQNLTDLRKRLYETLTGPGQEAVAFIVIGNGLMEIVRNDEDLERLDVSHYNGDPVTIEELLDDEPSVIIGSEMAFVEDLDGAMVLAQTWAKEAAEGVKMGWGPRNIWIGSNNGYMSLSDDVVEFIQDGGYDDGEDRKMMDKASDQGYTGDTRITPGPGECLACSRKLMALINQARSQ